MTAKQVLMKAGYAEIQAAADATDLWVYGDIGESWWDEESVTAKSVADALAGVHGGSLTVRVNSYGGAVADGIAIYNAIRRCKADTKRVEIDGVAMSSASLIAMAADPGELRIAANGILMIHAPWGYASGNAGDMRDMADILDRYATAMASSYVRGDITEADALALLTDGQDHYYTATEAIAAGFCDALSEDASPVAAHALRNLGIRAAAKSRYGDFHTKPAPKWALPGEPPMAVATANPKATGQAADQAAAETQTGTPPSTESPQAPAESDIQARAQQMIQAHHQALDAAFAPLMQDSSPNAALVREHVAKARADLSQTPDKVRTAILAELGRQTGEPMHGASYTRAYAGADQRDKHRAAAASWLLVRAGVRSLRDANGQDRPLAIEANPYRGYTLLDMARACLRHAGTNPDGMDKLAIVAAAFQTTSDFPVLLENVIHKTLLQAYRTSSDKWRRFCKIGTVSDFRAHNRYRVGSIGVFDSLTEGGEFRNKTIPDGEKSSITAATKGNIIGVTRETIINDDLGAMTDLSTALGRAGARTIEVGVFARLAENSGCGPTMADGQYLFSSAHANKEATTKGAPSVSTIAANRILLQSQKDISGNDYLDLSPAIWLGSLTDGDAARVVNGSTYDPDTANKLQRNNPVFGIFTDIIDTPRITGRYWYTFADPNEAPVFEVAFLDGMQEPYIETRNGWTTDGAEIKGRLDFGIAAVDYRGAARNDGA